MVAVAQVITKALEPALVQMTEVVKICADLAKRGYAEPVKAPQPNNLYGMRPERFEGTIGGWQKLAAGVNRQIRVCEDLSAHIAKETRSVMRYSISYQNLRDILVYVGMTECWCGEKVNGKDVTYPAKDLANTDFFAMICMSPSESPEGNLAPVADGKLWWAFGLTDAGLTYLLSRWEAALGWLQEHKRR